MSIVACLIIVWLGCWLTNCLIAERNYNQIPLRNWSQYGFFQLNGVLVENPGGLDEGEQPIFYPGHRPESLYPRYFVGQLFGVAGFSQLPFLIFQTTLISISTWFLLGRGKLALVCALIVPVCAGYAKFAVEDDPIGTAILLGFPGMVAVIFLWNTSTLWGRVGAAILAALVIQLNWPTIFPMAACLAYLFAQRPERWKQLVPLVVVMGASLALVTYLCVSARLVRGDMNIEPAAASGGAANLLWQNYLWGKEGYGSNSLTLAGALMRIIPCSLAGLLPYLLILVFLVLAVFRKLGWRASLLCLLPFLTAVIGILGLRNLVGHHPWMAGPPLFVAIIFSISLAIHHFPPARELSMKSAVALGSVSILYFVFVLLALRAKDIAEGRLTELIQDTTPRSARILLDPNLAATFSGSYSRANFNFDRKTFAEQAWQPGSFPGQQVYLVSTSPTYNGTAPIAHYISSDTASRGIFQPILDWYRKNAAHRKPGENLVYGDAYYIYRLQ